MGLYLIAERRQPTLVICHSKELMFQWRDLAIDFLGLPEGEIGLIGDGNKTEGDRLTIGIINSVYKKAAGLIPFSLTTVSWGQRQRVVISSSTPRQKITVLIICRTLIKIGTSSFLKGMNLSLGRLRWPNRRRV
jgi:hypothetical protein